MFKIHKKIIYESQKDNLGNSKLYLFFILFLWPTFPLFFIIYYCKPCDSGVVKGTEMDMVRDRSGNLEIDLEKLMVKFTKGCKKEDFFGAVQMNLENLRHFVRVHSSAWA